MAVFPWPKLTGRPLSLLLPPFVALMIGHQPPHPHCCSGTWSHTHLPGNGNVRLIHGPLLPGLMRRLAGAADTKEEVRAARSTLTRTWTGLSVNPALSQWLTPSENKSLGDEETHIHTEYSCTQSCHKEIRWRNIPVQEVNHVTPDNKKANSKSEQDQVETVRSH